jgi:hypothetical protein
MNKLNVLLVCGFVFGAVASCGLVYLSNQDVKESVNDIVGDIPLVGDKEEWHDIYTMTMKDGKLIPVGEATPAGGSGFISIFLLDYAQDAFVVLQNNATDWSASPNVRGYADADAFSEDTASEDPFFIVVRARFTKAVCYDEDDNIFVGNRTKCTITFAGDETGTITHYGNLTDGATGGGAASYNDSGGASLWINFFFDDGVDGYRVTDDGVLTISSIVISAKY